MSEFRDIEHDARNLVNRQSLGDAKVLAELIERLANACGELEKEVEQATKDDKRAKRRA